MFGPTKSRLGELPRSLSPSIVYILTAINFWQIQNSLVNRKLQSNQNWFYASFVASLSFLLKLYSQGLKISYVAGHRVLVQGRIMYGTVEDKMGQKRHTTTIVADDIIRIGS